MDAKTDVKMHDGTAGLNPGVIFDIHEISTAQLARLGWSRSRSSSR